MSTRVTTILNEAQMLDEARGFQPNELTGGIAIATTDEVRRALLSPSMDVLDEEAPQARLTI
ncbi:MAG: hypothetical protein AAGF78_08435 [Pseudomonadota bacterium]